MNTGMWIGGAALGAVVAFALGWFIRSQLGKARLRSAEQRAQAVLELRKRAIAIGEKLGIKSTPEFVKYVADTGMHVKSDDAT